MLARNPICERFDVPAFNPENFRSRFASPKEFLKACEELENQPQKPKLPGQDEAYGRSMRASQAVEKAFFELRLWAKVRVFARKHDLPETEETIDAMTSWQNHSWSDRFNAFSYERDLCSLYDRSQCLVTRGFRPGAKSLEDAIELANAAFKEEFEASMATIPFSIAHTGDQEIELIDTLSAKQVFNRRLDTTALILRGV